MVAALRDYRLPPPFFFCLCATIARGISFPVSCFSQQTFFFWCRRRALLGVCVTDRALLFQYEVTKDVVQAEGKALVNVVDVARTSMLVHRNDISTSAAAAAAAGAAAVSGSGSKMRLPTPADNVRGSNVPVVGALQHQDARHRRQHNWYTRHRSMMRLPALLRFQIGFAVGLVLVWLGLTAGLGDWTSNCDETPLFLRWIIEEFTYFSVVALCSLFVLWRKLRKHGTNDGFGIKTEMRSIFVLEMLAFGVGVIVWRSYNVLVAGNGEVLLNWIFIAILFALFVPMTVWPLHLSYRFAESQRETARIIQCVTRVTDLLAIPSGFHLFLKVTSPPPPLLSLSPSLHHAPLFAFFCCGPFFLRLFCAVVFAARVVLC